MGSISAREVSVSFFCLLTWFVLTPLQLFFVLRFGEYQRTKRNARNKHFVMNCFLQFFLLVLVAINRPMKAIIYVTASRKSQKNGIPAKLSRAVFIVAFYGILYSFLWRVWIVYFDHQLLKLVRNHEWMKALNADYVEHNWFKRHRHTMGSFRKMGFMMAATGFVFAVGHITIFLNFGHSTPELIYQMIGGVIPLTVMALIWSRTPQYADIYFIRDELKLSMVCSLPIFFGFFLSLVVSQKTTHSWYFHLLEGVCYAMSCTAVALSATAYVLFLISKKEGLQGAAAAESLALPNLSNLFDDYKRKKRLQRIQALAVASKFRSNEIKIGKKLTHKTIVSQQRKLPPLKQLKMTGKTRDSSWRRRHHVSLPSWTQSQKAKDDYDIDAMPKATTKTQKLKALKRRSASHSHGSVQMNAIVQQMAAGVDSPKNIGFTEKRPKAKGLKTRTFPRTVGSIEHALQTGHSPDIGARKDAQRLTDSALPKLQLAILSVSTDGGYVVDKKKEKKKKKRGITKRRVPKKRQSERRADAIQLEDTTKSDPMLKATSLGVPGIADDECDGFDDADDDDYEYKSDNTDSSRSFSLDSESESDSKVLAPNSPRDGCELSSDLKARRHSEDAPVSPRMGTRPAPTVRSSVVVTPIGSSSRKKPVSVMVAAFGSLRKRRSGSALGSGSRTGDERKTQSTASRLSLSLRTKMASFSLKRPTSTSSSVSISSSEEFRADCEKMSEDDLDFVEEVSDEELSEEQKMDVQMAVVCKVDDEREATTHDKFNFVLMHEEFFEIFMAHVAAEFSLENMLALIELCQFQDELIKMTEQSDKRITFETKYRFKFHSKIPKSALVHKKGLSIWEKTRQLYNKYVKIDATYELNLSSQVREKWKSFIRELDEQLEMQKQMASKGPHKSKGIGHKIKRAIGGGGVGDGGDDREDSYDYYDEDATDFTDFTSTLQSNTSTLVSATSTLPIALSKAATAGDVRTVDVTIGSGEMYSGDDFGIHTAGGRTLPMKMAPLSSAASTASVLPTTKKRGIMSSFAPKMVALARGKSAKRRVVEESFASDTRTRAEGLESADPRTRARTVNSLSRTKTDQVFQLGTLRMVVSPKSTKATKKMLTKTPPLSATTSISTVESMRIPPPLTGASSVGDTFGRDVRAPVLRQKDTVDSMADGISDITDIASMLHLHTKSQRTLKSKSDVRSQMRQMSTTEVMLSGGRTSIVIRHEPMIGALKSRSLHSGAKEPHSLKRACSSPPVRRSSAESKPSFAFTTVPIREDIVANGDSEPKSLSNLSMALKDRVSGGHSAMSRSTATSSVVRKHSSIDEMLAVAEEKDEAEEEEEEEVGELSPLPPDSSAMAASPSLPISKTRKAAATVRIDSTALRGINQFRLLDMIEDVLTSVRMLLFDSLSRFDGTVEVTAPRKLKHRVGHFE